VYFTLLLHYAVFFRSKTYVKDGLIANKQLTLLVTFGALHLYLHTHVRREK